MKYKAFVGKLLYRTVGSLLPGSSYSEFARKTRRLICQMILGKLDPHVNIDRGAHFTKSVTIGDYSGIGEGAVLQGTIHIGKYVMMAPNVKMYSVNHAYSDLSKPMCFQGTTPVKPIYMGDDVWIGDSVIILAGVHVGNGCVLGAGAVIREDVPDNAIVMGNPARVVKFRGSEKEF